MWRVRTASRLHLGLLSLPGPGERWPDRHGRPALAPRRFGGAGLMIDAPGLAVRVEPAEGWSAEGPLAGRALDFARRVARSLEEESPGPAPPPRRLVVEQAAGEHAGLGTGTQLGLAVARALLASWGLDEPAARLARRAGRGLRSALGVHGFERGGFLVEAGKRDDDELSPLVARLAVPAGWRVLVAVPPGGGRHGPAERAAFERLTTPLAATEALCRLVLLGMLPALAGDDLPAFGEAVEDFNARVGELFAPEQGGPYAGAGVAELVSFLRACGGRGVGQSSWGPGVFAFLADEDRARDLAGRVRDFLGGPPEAVWVARPANRGAGLEVL
jgi:beta-RFAP synthase